MDGISRRFRRRCHGLPADLAGFGLRERLAGPMAGLPRLSGNLRSTLVTRASTRRHWTGCSGWLFPLAADRRIAKPKGRTKSGGKPKSLRRGPDRRRKIIAAASGLFAEKGFEGASIREIAAASGVLSGSLYYHFPSKEELLFTVHQESLTAMRREVEAALTEVTEPWARLEEAIVAHCRILLGGSVTRAILTPPRHYNLQGVRKLVRQRDEYERIFTRLIDELPLKPNCDRHAFRLSMLGAMNWTVYWFNAGGRLSVDDIGRQIALVVRGAAIDSSPKQSSLPRRAAKRRTT
jgi:TetR/AcrR family transcriptional regulator, cholesterol catabolism regulator